jgi:hypothetical protein
MIVDINKAIVRAKCVNLYECIELIEDPVVRCCINALSSPERVANDAFTFMLVNLEDLGFVQFAVMIKTQNTIVSLQFINPALTTGNTDKGMAKKTAATTAATTSANNPCHFS